MTLEIKECLCHHFVSGKDCCQNKKPCKDCVFQEKIGFERYETPKVEKIEG